MGRFLRKRREPPWPPLYEWVRQERHRRGTDPESAALPDEAEAANEIRWAPGAFDGVTARHFAIGGAEDPATLAALVRSAASSGIAPRHYWKLYEALRPAGPPQVVDDVLGHLVSDPPAPDALLRLAVRLATESRHRNPVKYGIAMLGLFDEAGGHVEVIETLGRHEEFTLYAAVALRNSLSDPSDALWALAKDVRGWGRIEIVERLKDTDRADIREWILREGYSNSVMNEYSAYIAATSGDLVGALSRSEVDDQLLHAAGEILSALIMGGPAEDIDDYDAAPAAVDLYLRHMEGRARTLADLNAVIDVERFLEREDWEGRFEKGWSRDVRADLLARAREIVGRPRWREAIDEGLRDEAKLWAADRAARRLGISTLEVHLRRLDADPLAHGWHDAMRQADESNVDRIVDLAERRLPLDDIATGPADALGLGPEFAAHMGLGSVLQGLVRFPGRGWTLVATGLRSPVVNNRNGAVRVLGTWPRERWPEQAEAALRAAAAREPTEDARRSMEDVLAGKPLQDRYVELGGGGPA